MEATLQPRRFTSDDYHAMADHGIIPPGARVEVLDGLICIEIYRDPHDLGYATRTVFEREQTVTLLHFPDDELGVNDILPPLKPL